MFKEVHVDNIELHASAPQIAALLAQWRSLASGNALPSYSAFDPNRLPELAPNLAVVEVLGGSDYLYVHYGRAIAAESGVQMLGSRVSQWKSEIGAFFCSAYDRAVAERRPVYTVHRANHAARVHLWERLALPVEADDGSMRLVVFNKPREYNEDLLKTVLEASPDGIMGLRSVRSADGRVEDTLVLTANRRIADIIGCSVEKLLGRGLLEAVPDLKGSPTWARCVEVVETNQPQHFELSYARGGSTAWFNVSAVPLGDGLIISASEITALKNSHHELTSRNGELARANGLLRRQATELRAAEDAAKQARAEAEHGVQEVQKQNARFDAALNNMSQGLCFFDGAQRLIVCNIRYVEMYDLDPERVHPGITLAEIIDLRYAAGSCPPMSNQEYHAWRNSIAITAEPSDTVVKLKNGKVFEIHHRPMSDGGWVATHEDITERQSLSARLEENNQLLSERTAHLQAIIDNFPGGITFTDHNLRLVVANEKVRKLLDLPDRLFANGPPAIEELFRFNAKRGEYGPGDVEEQVAARLALGNPVGPHMFERERPDGTIIEARVVPLANGGFVTTYMDMTARRRSEARVAHMAHHDALTDLPNRVLLQERLERALARVRRGERLAVLCLDLDDFKAVNDTLGHPVGDTLLKAVAERLCDCIRDTDTVARLGGDEFAILQIAPEEDQDVAALARRIIESVHAPYDLDQHHVNIGISIGIAISPDDGVDPDQLIRNADLALYRAKAEGRGSYRFFETEMDIRLRARRELELDLRKALGSGQFELYYQPFVNLQRDDICGFEALLRWHHPERGMVSPAEFIPIAEDIGLIVSIGEWVLRHACTQATLWPDHIKIAVNLSPAQFKSPHLVQTVVSALATSGLPGRRLELEITESALLHNNDATLATVHQLRALGVRISMDDFGTGYSSLGYLQSFPFDKIKIDRSFISNLSKGQGSVAILKAIISLAGGLGMTTIAEGIETHEQLETVRAEGCTEMQGYLFSPPRPANEIAELFFSRAGIVESAA
jgi:diguanylate cyclase (GGDEF)-like protein